jgi:phosphatidylserine synthase
MFDRMGRRLAAPLALRAAQRIPQRITPLAITGFGLMAGVVCAISASQGWIVVSFAFWIINRLADGLDGALARLRAHDPKASSPTQPEALTSAESTNQGSTGEQGGYFDLMADFVTYAIVPVGIAWHVNTRAGWISLAVLLAVFYVNAASWTVLSAIQEKRGFGASANGERTSITMPTTIVEGTETILAYAAFLLFPASAQLSFTVFAVLVALSALQRMVWAKQNL